jgi:hypothetical protein
MFLLPLWSFHIGFVGGVPWSWAAEATTLSAYFIWLATWDLLWFLLNPRYGWARFRKGEIWWHGRPGSDAFPIDYWGALVVSLALAAAARLATGGVGVLGRHSRAGARLRRAHAAGEPRGAPLHALARAHAPARQRRARRRAATKSDHGRNGSPLTMRKVGRSLNES